MQQNETIECIWQTGRPTKYHSGLVQDLLNKRAIGWSNVMIAASWGISENTLYVWARENQEFGDVQEIAKTLYQAWWEEKGYKMVTGQEKGDFKTWISHMNKHHGWAGTNPNISTGDHIHIGNMNVLSLDQKEIDKKLADLMDRHGATSISDLKVKLLEHKDE